MASTCHAYRTHITAIVVGLLLGLIGCSAGSEVAIAEQAVSAFRKLTDAREFAAIYHAASDDLRKSTTEQDLTRILMGINAKLGAAKKSERTTWHVNVQTSGRIVTLGYKTEFQKATGTEQFVFRISGDKALLLSYNVSSNALLINGSS